DYQLAQRLQAQEQEELTDEEKARLFMERCKLKSLKNKSFANIQELFDKAVKRVNTFVDYKTELVEEREELEQESSKKQKVEEDKESEELKQCLEIVPDDGDDVTIDATPLSIKSLTIVDYKIYKEGRKSYFQIIRADVKARFKKTNPVNYMDNLLLHHLNTIFEHHVEDNERIVGIKRLLDNFRVTAAKVCVTAAKLKLLLDSSIDSYWLCVLIVQIWARSGFDGDRRVLEFCRRPPTKGVGLRVADSYTGNHRKDDFIPLETIRRFSSIIWEKILFELKGEASEPERRPVRLRNLFFGLWLVLEMDFRSFMIQGVDGEFNFLPEGGLDEGQDSSFAKSVNNRSPVVDADPISAAHPSAFAENIIYFNNASHESDDLTLVDLSEPYDPETGNTSKAVGKKKRAAELRDATDCHWVVAHVTPPSWKQHLKEISLEQLCDIYDRAYMLQAVLDNVLNNRTRELISALHKAMASCDAIREREVKKDKACVELEKNCNEALQDLDKNPLVSDMRSKIKTLQGQVNGLHNEYNRLVLEEKKWANYEQTLSTLRTRVKDLESKREKLKIFEARLLQEIDGLKQDRAAVVTKVVPDAAIKLIQSDEMGILVAKLVKAPMFRGRCVVFEEVANLKEPFVLEKMPGYRPSSKEEFDQAGDDLANASYPFLVKLTVDPYASMEQLLSKKPQSLRSNPALSSSKPLSLKAP
ncbi:hypothetical protein Tco_1033985, partial [Tanacetum coccineum]